MPGPFTPTAGQLGNMAGAASPHAVPPSPVAPGTADDLDGDLIRLCDQFVAAEGEDRRLGLLADISFDETDPAKIEAAADAKAAQDELLCWRLLEQIAELPARTPEGLRAKARAVFAFFNPQPPEYRSAAGPVLWSLVCELAGEDATVAEMEPDAEPTPAVPATGWQNPDRELIELCKEHVVNVHAYQASQVEYEDENDDPLWLAYKRTYEAIDEAEPQTIVGVIAKARAAQAEATAGKEGLEAEDVDDPSGVEARWAWHAMNDLLRIVEGIGIGV